MRIGTCRGLTGEKLPVKVHHRPSSSLRLDSTWGSCCNESWAENTALIVTVRSTRSISRRLCKANARGHGTSTMHHEWRESHSRGRKYRWQAVLRQSTDICSVSTRVPFDLKRGMRGWIPLWLMRQGSPPGTVPEANERAVISTPTAPSRHSTHGNDLRYIRDSDVHGVH